MVFRRIFLEGGDVLGYEIDVQGWVNGVTQVLPIHAGICKKRMLQVESRKRNDNNGHTFQSSPTEVHLQSWELARKPRVTYGPLSRRSHHVILIRNLLWEINLMRHRENATIINKSSN